MSVKIATSCSAYILKPIRCCLLIVIFSTYVK